MSNKHFFLIALFFFTLSFAPGQDSKLLLDKQGKWQVVDFGVYTHYICGFSKTETSTNYQKLVRITESVRKNPVLTELKGFDCMPTFYAQQCNGRYMYGIPSNINFEFHTWSWYKKTNKEGRWDIEPPHWDIHINNLWRWGNGANASDNTSPAERKPGFNKQKFDAATNKLNDLFQAPGLKETIHPGMDRWGETVVMYNPCRPAYWVPVTLKEVYETIKEYWTLYPDEITSRITLEVIEQGYATFSEEQKNMPAHGVGMLMGQYGVDESQPPIVKINPVYWNKNLPKSAIQFLWFICPQNKQYLEYEMQEQLKSQGGTYHLSRFIYALDADMLTDLIDK